MLTDAQRELLEDKFVLWDRASREGNMELRDYNRRAADALKAALAICSEAPTGVVEAARKLLREVQKASREDELSDYITDKTLDDLDAALASISPRGEGEPVCRTCLSAPRASGAVGACPDCGAAPPAIAPAALDDLRRQAGRIVGVLSAGELHETTRIVDARDEAIALERALASISPRGEGVGPWRPEVRAFADLMEAQLRANDHKPGWKGDSDLDLFERLGEESAELLSALHRHSKRLSWGDGWVMETDTEERIAREAADVANFAMMIADVCGALPAAPTAPRPAGDEEEGK